MCFLETKFNKVYVVIHFQIIEHRITLQKAQAEYLFTIYTTR